MTALFVWVTPLLLGGLFAAAAAIVAAPALRMSRTWSKATATVVDVEQFKSGGESIRRVELRFRGASNRDWTATCPVFQSVARFAKGSDIPILFDPRNPASVRVHTFMELWLLPAVVGSVGIISVIVGLCLAVSLS